MIGLLHRLSERAINGSMPRIRPLAPMPWLIAPQQSEPASENAPYIDTGTITSGFQPTSATEQQNRPSEAVVAPPRPNTLAEFSSAHPARPHDDVGVTAVADGALTGPTTFSFEALLPDAATLPASHPGLPVSGPASGDLPTPAEPPATSALVWNLPTPLLAAPATRDPNAEERRGRSSTARAVEAGEPVTEVHVRISRVELTALVETAAPQPKSRPTPAGRSLDEYLHQRQERLG